MDSYDAYARVKFKNPAPYPRPWDAPPVRIGAGTRLSVEQLRSILNQHRGTTSHKRDKNGRLRDERGRYAATGGTVLGG